MGSVKCRRCGRIVWQVAEAPLVDAHCEAHRQLYSSGEQLPTWVSAAVEASSWQTGRLLCECNSPLGGFDFVTGRKCPCGEELLPPVHLNLKKVDYVPNHQTQFETIQSRQATNSTETAVTTENSDIT